MYWNVRTSGQDVVENFESQGRFVVHRHCGAGGEHVDLRLECEGHLEGWRVDATSLEGECWATAKAPHPKRWLDTDGDAQRLDAGEYAWEHSTRDGGVLVLNGEQGWSRVEVSREIGIDVSVARDIRETLHRHGVDALCAPGLLEDGVMARRNAVERLCGLGSMLDGESFDDDLWRKTLRGLSLQELHQQLRGFELRFDRMHPPQPVSRPEALSDGTMELRSTQAMEIIQS